MAEIKITLDGYKCERCEYKGIARKNIREFVLDVSLIIGINLKKVKLKSF